MCVSKNVVIQVGKDEFLLYNPMTKVVDIIDEEVAAGLSNLSSLPEDAVSLLKRHGHITDEPESERERSAYHEYQEAYTRLSAAVHYYVIPTYNCNMRCIYCYQKDLRTEKKVISQKMLESFFKVAENNPPRMITLYGGEPLQKMTIPAVASLIRFCQKMDYNLSVCTNGLELKEVAPVEAFSHITVTLDGLAPVHNFRRPSPRKESFTSVVEAVEYVIKKDVPVTLSINADLHNIDNLPEFADFLISKGWHTNPNVSFELSHIIPPLDKDYPYMVEPLEAARKMVELYRKYPHMEMFLSSLKESSPLLSVFFKETEWNPKYWYCGANCYMHFYDPYGYIYPCYMVVGQTPFAIGRYHPQKEWFPHKKVWRERNCFTIPECRECVFSYFCGGGCCYRQYVRTGSLSGPYCDQLKAAEVYVPFLYNLVTQRGERL